MAVESHISQKTPDFLSNSAALANFLRLSLRESRTRVPKERRVVGNPGAERDMGHPRSVVRTNLISGQDKFDLRSGKRSFAPRDTTQSRMR